MLPRFHITFFISIVFIFISTSLLYAQSPQPYVVILSMDGFRWDYPDKWPTPNLDRIAARGVKAISLQPSFPSKTFPNHYTIATGLYPDHHGIVDNSFYDPSSGRQFSISDRQANEDPIFYGGEPIWVTAQKNGMLSAIFYWVGSEALIKGMRPTYWKHYDHDISFRQRIDTVIYWLNLPEAKRPHLVMCYMEEPDGIAHDEGPDGKGTRRMVMRLDSLMGVFMDKIEALPIAGQVNIIITSDHGMESISPVRCVNLKEILDYRWFDEIEGHSPNLTLKVKSEFADTAWNALSAIPHLTAWKHGMVPDSIHYGQNPRTLDFILVADSAWQFTMTGKVSRSLGSHGYNPYNWDMHAIFYAIGPAFKVCYKQPTFENVDIYPLICHILKITPAPADGRIERVSGMLNF
jgi:predicted AlkP superfamily pyrophosphatase or phosphodiesterase